jgi:hypothetical protein
MFTTIPICSRATWTMQGAAVALGRLINTGLQAGGATRSPTPAVLTASY